MILCSRNIFNLFHVHDIIAALYIIPRCRDNILVCRVKCEAKKGALLRVSGAERFCGRIFGRV